MPNIINALGTRANTTQPLEFQNPTTQAWVQGTLTSTAGGNEFAAQLTGVAAGTYAAGTLKMRIVGLPTVYTNQVAVTVTNSGSGGSLTSYKPAASTYANNKSTTVERGGLLAATQSGPRGSSYATAINVVLNSSLSNLQGWVAGTTTYAGLKVNGVFQRLTFVADNANHTVAVTNLTGNNDSLELLMPDLVRTAPDTTGVLGTVLVDVLANAPITWATPARPTIRVVVLTDSIGGGNVADEPFTQGWLQLLRAAYGASVGLTIYSTDGGSLRDLLAPSGGLTSVLDNIDLMADGTQENHFWAAIGVNDATRGSRSASQYGTDLANLLSGVHGRQPNTYVSSILPFLTSSANEQKVAPFRTAAQQAISGFSWLYRTADGSTWLTASQLNATDGIHPTTAGHQSIYNNAVNNIPVPAQAGGPAIQPLTATQVGRETRLTGNGTGNLEYQLDNTGSWLSGAPTEAGTWPTDVLLDIPAGTHTITGRLKSNPATKTSTTIKLNPVIFRDSSLITLYGSDPNTQRPDLWTNADNDPHHGAYSNAQGASFLVSTTQPVVGFRVIQDRNSQAQEIYVVNDSSSSADHLVIQADSNTIPGLQYVVYTSPVLTASTHTMRVYIGGSPVLQLVAVELILA